MQKQNEEKQPENNIEKKDFYEQACAYFYYHAEQRTTMINFYIAVFAACLALYGSLLTVFPVASILIAVFTTIVSLLFFMIDLRNRFDVKQSQHVITQIERDCDADKALGDYAYGVFSNEDNVFKFYKPAYRKNNKEYKRLRKAYKLFKQCKLSEQEFDKMVEEFAQKEQTASPAAIKASLESGAIFSLSSSIKMLYILCGAISVLAFVFALLKYLNVV